MLFSKYTEFGVIKNFVQTVSQKAYPTPVD